MKSDDHPGKSISPCERYKCHECCKDTRMTLSQADIIMIERLGHRDFFTQVDGFLQLKNVDGSCIFLRSGRCRIYSSRPLGCRLYPIIWDVDDCEAFQDDLCPHIQYFPVESWHHEILKKVIALEDAEREERTQ